ncbi:MAG: response regulator [Nitrospirae bacterium]|nr:response regulator [Nitrospirota bacterium]
MSYKLLLADDSLTIQKVVELVLANENFEIKTTNDGEQALAVLESFSPDIVLADIDMPKINGYQLCEKVKKSDTHSRIPVILLAGAFEPFDEAYAKSVSADDFIIKPFESQELISKVKALLAAVPPAPPELVVEEEPVSATIEEPISDMPDVVDTSELEEPKWDEDVKIETEEKAEGQRTVDEDYEAQAALAGGQKEFDKVLDEAIEKEEIVPQSAGPSELRVAVRMPTEEQVLEIIRQEVRGQIDNLFSSLRGDVEAAINKHVPEIAESIIRKEIEKITSEL